MRRNDPGAAFQSLFRAMMLNLSKGRPQAARSEDRSARTCRSRPRQDRLSWVEPPRSGIRPGRCGIGATVSPERAPAKVRNPPRADLRRRTKRQILTVRSEAMPPERCEPKNGERGRDDCRPEHYAKLGERLISAGREPGQ